MRREKWLQICYSPYSEFWKWRPLSDPSKGLTRVDVRTSRRRLENDEILGVRGERDFDRAADAPCACSEVAAAQTSIATTLSTVARSTFIKPSTLFTAL